MAGFFQTLAELIEKALDPGASDTLPPAPEVIHDFGVWLSGLKNNSVKVDGDLKELQQLLNHLKPPGGADGPADLGDSMLVRMLQHAFPRVAEGLTLLGLIEYTFVAGKLTRHRINWSGVSELFSDPGGVLHKILSPIIDNPNGAVNAHLLSVQLAALLLAPRPLLLMEHDGQGFVSLPAVPDGGPLDFLGNPWKPLNDAPWLFKLGVSGPRRTGAAHSGRARSCGVPRLPRGAPSPAPSPAAGTSRFAEAGRFALALDRDATACAAQLSPRLGAIWPRDELEEPA